MQRLQSPRYLYKGLPNLALLDSTSSLEVGADKFHEIASFGELHDDAEVS